MSPIKRKDKLRVAILFGGQSGEHEVSLNSANSIMQAIDRRKYEVTAIGISKDGRWLAGEDVHQQLMAAAQAAADNNDEDGEEKGADALPPQASVNESLSGALADVEPVDVIFPVLHGPFGEDGTVQGFLELIGIPYVGAGVMASAVGMDKIICKDIFKAHGLPIVSHRSVLRQRWRSNSEAFITECEQALTYPMFIKPANLGSSVGIHKATNSDELRAGLDDAARYDRKLLVEQGVDGREIEVSVLGNNDPVASIPGEIVPSREFYSYAAKYIDQSSELLIPAPLDIDKITEIQDLALAAFRALDCAGLARCDFLLDKSSEVVYLNEVNTMPGFTNISMYPKLWAASGLEYSDLIDRLIELALERFDEKQQSTTFFDVSTAQ